MIDFAVLYQHSISQSCTRWSQCGSHCCTMGKALQGFDPDQALVVLPIPESEYHYLRANAAPGTFWPSQPRKICLEIADYTLTLYLQPCSFGGACHAPIRPAICRMYPYIPLIDDDLNVSGVQNASALDLVWEHASMKDPCILRHAGPRAHIAVIKDLVSRLRQEDCNYEMLLWWNLAYRYLERFRIYLAENISGLAPDIDLFHLLHLCNKNQLFLAEPEFKASLEGEVQRYRHWMGNNGSR